MIDVSIHSRSLKNIDYIDLFAGIGGFRLALDSFGASCVFTSEWDKHSQDVYIKNFGDEPDGDITKIKEKDIPKHDMLFAGFPCQSFSISGKQKGFDDLLYYTWTCWYPNDREPCGECHVCRERIIESKEL